MADRQDPWSVFLSAAYVLAVLTNFERVLNRETEIILAAIGLTYVALRHGIVGQHLEQVNFAKAIDVEFGILRRMIDPNYTTPIKPAVKRKCSEA